ncbi:hypothetical protein EYF80_005639 [Liparis tanakae]|uniref:Uncharacterized protein n=1 Tax=Liparis tanakae TaxID=230148 RepID=A0A4Z2J3G9_9TELE|nr:hypothetical protein EYF80_005639 [Liparis tanakae]
MERGQEMERLIGPESVGEAEGAGLVLACLCPSPSLSPTFGPRCLEDLPISFSSSSSHCSSRSKMSSSYTTTHRTNKSTAEQ